MLTEIANLAPGQVQTFLWEGDPDSWVDIALDDEVSQGPRVVFHRWDSLPDSSDIITSVLQALARVVAGLWPNWYGQASLFTADPTAEADLLNRYRCLDWQRQNPEISLPWLRAAVRAQQQGHVPVLTAFPHSLQLAQLALAIEPNGIGLVLWLTDSQPPQHRLLALAQAVNWIATHTQARIALALPQSLAGDSALDAVLYGAKPLAGPATPTPPVEDEAKHVVFPIRGRPHPFSPGEAKLAQWLAQDAELGPLFRFNQMVKTIRQQTYLVDLLWAEGRVIVEVDGYRHHGNRFGFAQDRHRDYELLISDYVVLRLPHDAVISDVEVAVEKIRDVVRFRRQQLSCTHEVSL
ncbi:MAG: DUF559 domain-containing protein [Leptolyngbya sp. LCM1.Bin17]|nr:MAG: DUF559 domain-containing protein [Leptolyngbya sp. LCM1.Bin17]